MALEVCIGRAKTIGLLLGISLVIIGAIAIAYAHFALATGLLSQQLSVKR